MTLEYRDSEYGQNLVVTKACGLCGETLRERQGMADHLPSCPVRSIYAEPGALRNGGPDPERLQAALEDHDHADHETAQIVADGGPEVDR